MYEVPEYDGLPITWGMAYPGDIDKWTLPEIRHIRAQYAGEITLVDKWIGVFLEKVSELGLLDNTLILFLSDHGEPLGEHEIVKKSAPWPYDELSHVPFILRLPDGMEKGRRIDTFVGMPDVMPTLLEWLGVKSPNVIHGKSILRMIRGDEKNTIPFGISGYYGQSWSIRNRGWSYYVWFGLQRKKVEPELYEFDPNYISPKPSRYESERDLAEKDNIVKEEPEIAKSLELEMMRFLCSLSPSIGDRAAIARVKRRGFSDFLSPSDQGFKRIGF